MSVLKSYYCDVRLLITTSQSCFANNIANVSLFWYRKFFSDKRV